MEKYIYKGKSFPVKAQVVGERLMSLYKKSKKQLTPQMVLEDAKKSTSPLHDCFEWNNNEAANKYRLSQAGDLIRSVTVIRKNKDDKEVQVRGFINIRMDENNVLTSNYFQKKAKSFYVTVNDVMSDDVLKKYTLEMALKELSNYMDKYKNISELSELFDSINKKVEKIKVKNKKKLLLN